MKATWWDGIGGSLIRWGVLFLLVSGLVLIMGPYPKPKKEEPGKPEASTEKDDGEELIDAYWLLKEVGR